ncbi:hypothetical protein B0H16DRAFT_107368 [Mycena metata]|uniref:Uncharacterized protein n=1 Tax=Mycena metata TaxID=1033252 RepID=A0AAD7I9Q5_9AGAR|nr:hypothetical protein B0H16DRAFT_107368 [Mycena metata]
MLSQAADQNTVIEFNTPHIHANKLSLPRTFILLLESSAPLFRRQCQHSATPHLVQILSPILTVVSPLTFPSPLSPVSDSILMVSSPSARIRVKSSYLRFNDQAHWHLNHLTEYKHPLIASSPHSRLIHVVYPSADSPPTVLVFRTAMCATYGETLICILRVQSTPRPRRVERLNSYSLEFLISADRASFCNLHCVWTILRGLPRFEKPCLFLE